MNELSIHKVKEIIVYDTETMTIEDSGREFVVRHITIVTDKGSMGVKVFAKDRVNLELKQVEGV